MISTNERRVQLRAEMAELLWEVASPIESKEVKNLLADIQILAMLKLTLFAAIFIYGLHNPVILSASIVGITFSLVLLALNRLSLSKNITRIERAMWQLATQHKR